MVEKMTRKAVFKDSLAAAVEAANVERNKAAFEKAMQAFLRSHPETHEELNEGVLVWVVENQERIRTALDSETPDAVTPLRMYNAAHYAIESLKETKKAALIEGWRLDEYFPFRMGLVQFAASTGGGKDIYNLTPTPQGLELHEKCFPDLSDPGHVLVALIGDPFDFSRKEKPKRGRKKK